MLISSGGKQFRAETWLRGQPCVACSDQPMNYYCGDIKYQTVRQPQPQQDPAFVPPKVRWENLINSGPQTNCGDQQARLAKIFANQNCSGHIHFGILKYRKGHGRLPCFNYQSIIHKKLLLLLFLETNLDMFPMSLDTLNKMLNPLIINFIAEHSIVLNNQTIKSYTCN